jgi:predicted enzyme related to lactoylglutathione lyase
MVDLLVNIDVDDLQRAIVFYTGAFDLRIGRRFGTDGVELLGASAPIYLLVKAPGTQPFANAKQLRDYERHWTSVHLDFVVQGIDKALARAVAAGATVERPTQTSSWGKLALLVDPFGNGLCLVEFLGRGYDEIATS